MKLTFTAGATSKAIRIYVEDATNGGALTGLAYNTTDLVWHWIGPGDAGSTAVTMATMTVGTWVSGGFKEVSSTNMPGVYEIGIPDAALADAGPVNMMLHGAADMADVTIELQVDPVPTVTQAYADGAIWLDTNASNTNTVAGTDGTIDNPVSTIAAAQTLSGSTGINLIRVAADSTVTLTATLSDVTLEAMGPANLELNNRAVTTCRIVGFAVTESATSSTGTEWIDCRFDDVSISSGFVSGCLVRDEVGLVYPGTIEMKDCATLDPVIGCSFNFSGYTNGRLHLHNWSGDFEVLNLGDSVSQSLYVTGSGVVTINANCTGGDIYHSPFIEIDDNSGGAVTLTPIAAISVDATKIDANVVEVLGEPLVEDNSGRLATNASTFLNNGNLATTATLDSISTLVNRLGAFTGTGVNTVLGFFLALMRKDADLPSDVGGTYDEETDSLEALQEAGGITDWTPTEREQIRYRLVMDGDTSAPADTNLPQVAPFDGGGAYAVTLSFVDDQDPAEEIVGAQVRIVRAGFTDIALTTDSSGQVHPKLDAATYTVSATAAGHEFYSGSLEVTGADSPAAYEMPLTVTITNDPPNTITGLGFVHNQAGVGEDGVEVTATLVEGTGDDGYVRDGEALTDTSSGGGNISIAGFIRGAKYSFQAGNGSAVTKDIPMTGSNFQIPELIRTDS